VALVGIPIAVAGLLDLVESEDRAGIGMTAIGLALSGLGYWFNAFFLGLLIPVFWWHGSRRRSWKSVGVDLLAAGGVAVAIVAPILLVIFWPALNGEGMPGTHIDPTELNLIFGDALRVSGGQATGLANWLPYGLIVGMLLTVWQGKRRVLWVILAALCVVFSMGPGQMIGDSVYRFPYWLLWKGVPGLARMFHPERWMLVGGVFLTVASVDGLARVRPRWTWLLPIAVLVQLSFRGVTPLGAWSPDVPAHWNALSEERDQGALIVVPVHRSQLAGAHQWVHERALYGGMVEDQPWAQPTEWREYEQRSPLLRSLRALSYGREVDAEVQPEDIERLLDDGFSRVVLDRFSWSQIPHAAPFDPEAVLTRAFGAPIHRSEAGVVWVLRSP
jgi:hypothetical protein